jgi:hypothetical protein
MEESSDEGLDYFVVLDVAAAETSSRMEGAGDLPSAGGGRKRRRVVGKHSVGEFSRSGRRRRMGMEHSRLRVSRVDKRELLSLPASVDEAAKAALLAKKKGKALADNTHQEACEDDTLSKRQRNDQPTPEGTLRTCS